MRGSTSLRTALGVVATTTVTVLPVFLLGALSVEIARDLRLDVAVLGLVVAAYFGVSALVSLPVGRLVERLGPGVTGRLAVVGAAVGMLLTATVVDDLTSLVAILLGGAWCNVMGQLSTNVTLSRAMSARRLGLSFGVKQASVPLATLLAGLAVPTVVLTVGWRWAYLIAAGLALVALTLTPAPGPPADASPGSAAAERATGALAVLGASAGLGAAAATGLGIFLVSSAVAQGVPVGLAGLVLTLGSIVGLVMRMVNGWLADRRSGGHVAVVAACLLTGAIGLLLLSAPGPLPLVVGTVLGFGLGWSWPGLLQFAVVRLNPAAPAAATAIIQVGVYAGGFLGPVGFGLLAAGASFTAAWLVGAAAMLLAGCGVLVGRRLLLHHRDLAVRR